MTGHDPSVCYSIVMMLVDCDSSVDPSGLWSYYSYETFVRPSRVLRMHVQLRRQQGRSDFLSFRRIYQDIAPFEENLDAMKNEPRLNDSSLFYPEHK